LHVIARNEAIWMQNESRVNSIVQIASPTRRGGSQWRIRWCLLW